MFSQKEQSGTQYSGDYALQTVPRNLKIRQPVNVLFRIFIGCLTMWKSLSYSHAPKQPYYSKCPVTWHIECGVMVTWICCHAWKKLLQKSNRVQTTFFLNFSSCIGVFLGDNRLMGERLWMYCSVVANSVSLYCKSTYVTGVEEAVLLVAAERATVFWVNMCTSCLCFRSNFIRMVFFFSQCLPVVWEFHLHGFWVLWCVPIQTLCVPMWHVSAGSFYLLAFTQL
jgi:hypothetical protein